MLPTILVAALAGIGHALPQGISIPDPVLNADPVPFTVPLDVVSNTPPKVAPAPIKPITTPVSKVKRGTLVQRDGDCKAQPAGSGPVPSPDTAAAFSSSADLQVCLLQHTIPMSR